jgi:hypothetical protein
VVEPDRIQIGKEVVQIDSINYREGAIALREPVECEDHTPVSDPYYGKAPDLGAYEYVPGGSEPEPTPGPEPEPTPGPGPTPEPEPEPEEPKVRMCTGPTIPASLREEFWERARQKGISSGRLLRLLIEREVGQ